MAVASSAFENMEGIMKREASRYAISIEDPAFKYTTAGRMNIPELIMAPDAMAKTSFVPNERLSLCSEAVDVDINTP